MKKNRTLSTVLLAALLASGCATTQDLQTMQSDLNESRRVAFENRNQVRELGDRLTVLEQKNQAAPEKPQPPANEDVIAGLRQSQAELGLRIEEISRELRAIQGRVEELQFGTERNLGDLNNQKDVLMIRISALEERLRLLGPAAGQPSASTAPPASATSSSATSTEPPAAQAPAEGAVAKTAGGESADDLYKQGHDLFNAREYGKARQVFQKFLDIHPNHKFAGNAQFWKGETFYAEKDYENAILAYEDVLRKYKQSEKTAGALLKQGYAFAELGDNKTARIILERVREKHAGAPEAELASKKLESLGQAK